MRREGFSRRLMRENHLRSDDLIYPVFVLEGEKAGGGGVLHAGCCAAKSRRTDASGRKMSAARYPGSGYLSGYRVRPEKSYGL